MAAPTTVFTLIANTKTAAELDTEAERLTEAAAGAVKSTGDPNETDFGTVDISGGAANSGVLTMTWRCTVNGGNTTIDNAEIWLATNGFVQAGSVIKHQPLTGDDTSSVVNTESYIVNAVVGSYTWATMPESEQSTANLWVNDGSTGEQTSIDITTPATSDDAVMWATYAAIAASETTGTYRGLDSGYELRYNLKYEYS